jgi:signal transduction histidine kinase
MHVSGAGASAERLLPGRAARVALILVLGLAAVAEARLAHPPPVGRERAELVKQLGLAFNVIAVACLFLARRRPFVAALGVTLMTIRLVGAHEPSLTVLPFCVLLVLIAWLVTRRSLLFAAPLLIPFVLNTAKPLDGNGSSLSSALPLLLLLAALVVGEAIRKRQVAVAALDATEEAMAESVRLQTVMEERARIARELHDIVAHHLSVIAVESEVARRTSPELSPEVGGRLEAIASTAREALTETRRLLGVLREDTRGVAERAPQPGLGELDALIETARATGTRIRLTREGDVARLPLSVDLAAYRIVQEALTNARRHAPGADVDIELSYRAEALLVRVRDYGPGASGAEPVEGHGLMGMRERAALASGTFSSGPAVGGGFEVDVTLPVTETAT